MSFRNRPGGRAGGALMELNVVHHDALADLINIGFGRAGASLSRLTGQRLLLDASGLAVHSVDRLAHVLRDLVSGDVASIHQSVSGPVAGDARLLFDARAASTLKELLTGERALPLALDASAGEVLTEVGNIVINACVGTLGNLLRLNVGFSAPAFAVAPGKTLVDGWRSTPDQSRYAVVLTAGFRLRDAEVSGYLMIVLSVQSLDRLNQALQDWDNRQRQ
jgi:chemotaxis protein CheC